MQAADTRVRALGEGAPRPRVEISLRYGDAAGTRTLVLEDQPQRLDLEHSVNNVLLPLLEDLGLLPAGAQAVDDPPGGQRTTHQIGH